MFNNFDKIYALLIGNDLALNKSLGLDTCDEDIKRITNLLPKNKTYLQIYRNCNPKDALNKFLESVGKANLISTDVLYIYYSGHGDVVGKKINGKIVLLSSWIYEKIHIYSDEIDAILSTVPCKILLASDSCHSGEFGKFYTGKSSYLFIGSSSIVNKSKESFKIKNLNPAGILTCLFENMQLNPFDNPQEFEKAVYDFFTKYRIKILPIIKRINE